MKNEGLTKDKYLSKLELADLERRLTATLDDRDDRNALFISLALCTGSRPQEVLNIRKRDIDRENATILIRGLKGSNTLECPIPRTLFLSVLRYSDTVNGEVLFPFSYETVRNIWKQWTPNKYKSFKALRHTHGLTLYQKTKDIRLVQCALRHRTIENTMRYQTYVYTTEELRRAQNLK